MRGWLGSLGDDARAERGVRGEHAVVDEAVGAGAGYERDESGDEAGGG